MELLERNTQVNFRTNSELLKKAKAIVTAQNLDMTASFNLFLENIVKNNALPFETDSDKAKADLLAELRADIARSFDDLEQGRVYSLSEVRERFGIV